jgi:hypothetical protein
MHMYTVTNVQISTLYNIYIVTVGLLPSRETMAASGATSTRSRVAFYIYIYTAHYTALYMYCTFILCMYMYIPVRMHSAVCAMALIELTVDTCTIQYMKAFAHYAYTQS